MKRFVTILLALVMILSMATTAFAQTVGTAADNTGTITITNAAKGETYTIYKLFDASVTGTDGGSIAYTGEIPAALADYFTKDAAGNITATDAAMNGDQMSDGLKAALKTWAGTASATASVVSDGSTLQFVGLAYGYYVVTTTQGEQAISVTSTNPTASIVDKNSSTPSGLVKKADDGDVNIGQTVTYTVTFTTANYDGAGESAKQIVSYTITDTLPAFLKDVTVTSITIDGTAYTVDGATPQFTDGKIVIPWVDAAGNSLYKNGAEIVITYTAVVDDDAAIDGAGNTNKVTVTWQDEDGDLPSKLEDEETIYTYAIALKKVDQDGNPLAGATFQFPFYVKATPDTDGAYIYAGTTAGEGLTNTITTPASGEIVVKGVASGTYSITETAAPAGYNKLTAPVEVTAVKTGETTTKTTTYLDANGNIVSQETDTVVIYENNNLAATVIVVVNKTGELLPETGGMGTTLFYAIGGMMVLAAVVLLVTKKRMNIAE